MIQTLSGENFLPFREKFELPLGNQGLVLIRGRNLISAAADANGVGKTSIPHAICFTLFGEDLRGRRGDAVACRFTEGLCWTRLDMIDSLGEWSVQRTRRPAGLHVAGIPGIAINEDMAVTQQKIEQRLGFGVRTFKNAVVFGQGSFERFAHADQAEKMRMLDEIQGLDLHDALDRAKAWRDQLQGFLAEAEREQDENTTSIGQIEWAIDNLDAIRQAFSRAKGDAIARLDSRRPALAQALQEALEAQNALQTHAQLLAKLEPAVIKLNDLLAEVMETRAKSENCEIEVRKTSREYARLEEEIHALRDMGDCPTCRQPVKKNLKNIIAKFTPDIHAARAEKEYAELAAARAAKDWTSVEEREALQRKQCLKLLGRQTTLTTLDGHVAVLRSLCSPAASDKAKAAVVATQTALKHLDMEIAAERNKVWDGQKALDGERVRLDVAKARTGELAARVKRVADMLPLAQYWIEAFGDRGIRSLLVDSVAEYINQRLALHLEHLACGEVTSRMSPTTALKKGGAREGISFETVWAWGGAGKDDGSGGQDRRVDLALFAAIQDMAEARSARPFPIKIWDEPGDALDARGKELFMHWIAREARSRGTGLLITHDETIASQVEVDVVWDVVLAEDGARIETKGYRK